MEDELRALEERLQVDITDYDLLQRALTHRSYLNESQKRLEDNERPSPRRRWLDLSPALPHERFPEMDGASDGARRLVRTRTRRLRPAA